MKQLHMGERGERGVVVMDYGFSKTIVLLWFFTHFPGHFLFPHKTRNVSDITG
jgi:hypothetical protein